MSKLSFYIDYLKRSQHNLRDISSKENISILYLWYDFVKCSLIHGAILNHYTRGRLFELKGCQRRKSMTYRRILNVYKRCNQPGAIKVLNSKHIFNSHFAPFVKRKWLYSKDMTFEQFLKLCEDNEAVIVKPEDGVEGVGVKKLLIPADMAGRKELFASLGSGSYMIEELIQQHSAMAFNNSSVNTVRIHSIIDRNGDVQILKILLRVGVGDTVVDNYAKGGCVYELDPDSGRIISPSLMKTGEVVYVHPGSDIFVLGRQVPNWEKVISGIKSAHKLLPDCRFIGWDVAVTQNGIELIEGNHNPDYEFLEFFGTKGWYYKIKKHI